MRCKQPFGGFADQHKINVPGPRVCQRDRDSRNRTERTHTGIQAKIKAQVQLRRNFGAVGVAHGWQSHGAQQNGIR